MLSANNVACALLVVSVTKKDALSALDIAILPVLVWLPVTASVPPTPKLPATVGLFSIFAPVRESSSSFAVEFSLSAISAVTI